ncbi:MAG: F0F1 ATP synthase subunit gamma, partial [Actinobacteria bacterium]|nr:F0F1 ATP synthase subunit gamma [Actinomycetota bacterium]
METAEQLKKKIGSAEDLRDLVRTMKLLAVTNIRRFQEAVEALADYYHTIEMGLQIALQREALNTALGAGGWQDMDHPQGDLGLVVLGTDQGLCGRYNEVVVDFSREVVEQEFQGERPRSILCVGLRPALQLEHL